MLFTNELSLVGGSVGSCDNDDDDDGDGDGDGDGGYFTMSSGRFPHFASQILKLKMCWGNAPKTK